MTLTITPIPAFNDNYIWMIMHPSRHVVIVDPGDAAPVIQTLKEHALQLSAIFITHHHWDHTNGIKDLINYYPVPVYGPIHDPVPAVDRPLQNGDCITVEAIESQFTILSIPGHTLGHIAFVGAGGVFCGDTLFTGGCGRLFEGAPQQMVSSLKSLAALSEATLVYCGHEYTEANLAFALKVEPDNQALQQRIADTRQLRTQRQPTVPAPMHVELATNPFLRCHLASVQQAVSQHTDADITNEIAVFAALREWKNQQ